VPALDLVEARETVHVRHAHVQEHELRLGLPDERQHLGSGLRLADDLEIAVALECPPDAVEHEPMVVGDHDPHDSQCGTGGRRFRTVAEGAPCEWLGWSCPRGTERAEKKSGSPPT
jgi:hypothetical protein